jgi:uncharacterized repeat protein (TIGR03943 family)
MIGMRTLRIVVLAAWAGFLADLWLTGDAALYLGERTLWVAPFGAAAATAALLGVLLRPAADRVLNPRDTLGMLVLVAPILAVIAIPHGTLGAAAAERRALDPKVAAQQLSDAAAVTPAAGAGEIVPFSFAHIMAASVHPQPGVEPGVRVQLTGFVMRHDAGSPSLFDLGRFQINCCIADASALFVTVDGGEQAAPPVDQWVVVTGPLALRGDDLIVAGESVQPIDPPERPYLYQGKEIAVPPTTHGTQPPSFGG